MLFLGACITMNAHEEHFTLKKRTDPGFRTLLDFSGFCIDFPDYFVDFSRIFLGFDRDFLIPSIYDPCTIFQIFRGFFQIFREFF